MIRNYAINVGGLDINIETGYLAKQASGSVRISYGETVILVTACMTEKPREGLDFFPLLVDYEERYYSAGKIPGGFIKREGRPAETATIGARVIDRSIRSLFDDRMRHDVHVVATILSVDQLNPPNVLAINGASAALTLSDIPWSGPVGAVRIGYIDGELVVNPTEVAMAESTLDLIVSGHLEGITMVEAGAKEVSESLLADALELAHEEIKKICRLQLQMREEIGKEKFEFVPPATIPEIDGWIEENLSPAIRDAVLIHAKQARGVAIEAVKTEAAERFAESHPDAKRYISDVVEGLVKKIMRKVVVEERLRADGRAMDEVRPISCEVGVLPRTHGSAVFTRGETQALVTATLGMMGNDDQILDGIKLDEPPKKFMLHYNFPPYSVGEVRPMRGPGRREIGHGALAERAVRAMMPADDDYPYVVRVVSDILESNGSSSMATVCGASLAIMDAGVPLAKPVAGIAMGLIKEGDAVEVLTDIQGLEDHYGDMDFKVAGTVDGVTALQMDNKAGGITRAILERALNQARDARLHILSCMEKTLKSPREEMSPHAPRIYTMQISVDRIRDVIGPGGKIIRKIIQETGCKIDVEDDGRIFIASPSSEKAEEAIGQIRDLTRDVNPGEVFYGKVTRLMNFGAFVEVLPGKEGLLHVSEVSTHHVPKLDEILQPGDQVLVVVKEIDDLSRVNLSRRRVYVDRRAELEADEAWKEIFAAEDAREAIIAEKAAAGGGRSAPRHDGDRGPRRDGDRLQRGGDRGRPGGSRRPRE
ncbi:MAG: polyribonucleotide nucleotidyltransferase [Synergistaceae bacterium]|nr:polyribonucleotide nucleotidyltransferase [Synergistaceae bacterium]